MLHNSRKSNAIFLDLIVLLCLMEEFQFQRGNESDVFLKCQLVNNSNVLDKSNHDQFYLIYTVLMRRDDLTARYLSAKLQNRGCVLLLNQQACVCKCLFWSFHRTILSMAGLTPTTELSSTTKTFQYFCDIGKTDANAGPFVYLLTGERPYLRFS